MAIHCFVCDICKISIEDTDTKTIHRCPKCNKDMRWDIAKIGIADGDYSHISDSLAINPSQIAEHNRMFPGIKVHPDGRPEFNSVKQQSDYLKKIGFVKHPQKLRGLGKKRI